MPPPSSILASTIGVTFVRPKNLPQKTMPGFLWVNRAQVWTALQWLQQNNPLYAYQRNVWVNCLKLEMAFLWKLLCLQNIALTSPFWQRREMVMYQIILRAVQVGWLHLCFLALFDMVLSFNRFCVQPLWHYGCWWWGMWRIFACSSQKWYCSWSQFSPTLSSNFHSLDEEIIPLQSLGVVDLAASDINENEILTHALATSHRVTKLKVLLSNIAQIMSMSMLTKILTALSLMVLGTIQTISWDVSLVFFIWAR